jgi:multicomponent Na+:H+ antiporter subunit E
MNSGDSKAAPVLHSVGGAAAARTACFVALWLVLMPSLKPGDLAVGAFAVAVATWSSLRLLPPSAGGLRLGRLLMLMPYYLRASVLAGVDVALRAFSPRVRVQPGYLEYPVLFPPGLARNTYSSITSLLPGTVPCGHDDGELVYHCLDTAQPVLEQLAAEEQRLSRALVAGAGHD